MARKMMTKEVTFTSVTLAKMQMVDGTPQALPVENEILLGNVNLERAQRVITKKYGTGVTVFKVEPTTEVYEMEVEEFIKHAKIKQ